MFKISDVCETLIFELISKYDHFFHDIDADGVKELNLHSVSIALSLSPIFETETMQINRVKYSSDVDVLSLARARLTRHTSQT